MQVGKHIPHSWLCTLDVLNILEGRGGCARVTFGAKYLLHSLNLDMLVLGMRVSQNGPAFPFSSIYSRVWIFRPCKPFLEKKKKTHICIKTRTPNPNTQYLTRSPKQRGQSSPCWGERGEDVRAKSVPQLRQLLLLQGQEVPRRHPFVPGRGTGSHALLPGRRPAISASKISTV